MRIVASTVPSWGHLVPMLGVLGALRDSGHQITVATHTSLHASVRSFGFEPVAAGMSEADLLAERLSQWPHTRDAPPSEWAPRMFREIAAPTMTRDLTECFTDNPPDLIIAEEGEYGGAAFAAKFGVPLISHGWGSPGTNATFDHPARAHIDPCPASLNPAPPDLPHRCPVRLDPPRLVPSNPELDAWLEHRDRQIVYVSLGTVALYADAPDLIRHIVDVVLGAGLDVVATGSLPSGQWPEDRVRVKRMVELGDVLPRCALVICHAGAGTVLAALAHALPLVLLPRGAPSQKRMAHACEHRGVARRVVDSTSLDHVVREVLTGNYRLQAQQVAHEIATLASPAEVAQQVVEHAAAPPSAPRIRNDSLRKLPSV